MQPYQKANEKIREQGEAPLKLLKGAGKIAQFGIGGAGAVALGRVLPFLSKYIPQSLAIKGLSKVNPGYGTFINKALDAGKSFDEIKEFIRNKFIGNEQENQEPEEEDDRDAMLQQSQEKFGQRNKPSMIDEETARFQKGYGNQQQNTGGLDPKLAQIMQQMQQTMNKITGG